MEHPSDLTHIGGLSGKSDQSSDMDDALAIVGKMVKGFLATRPATPSSRADIVFDQVSVEGNGKGVCFFLVSTRTLSTKGASMACTGSSGPYHQHRRHVLPEYLQSYDLSHNTIAVPNSASRLLWNHWYWGNAASHWKTRKWMHNLPKDFGKHAWRIQINVRRRDLWRSVCKGNGARKHGRDYILWCVQS